MNTNFIEKTLSSLVEQQMNISNAVLKRQPSCYEIYPSKQNVAFHNWEEYKNGRYEEKGIVLLEEEELKRVRQMQIFLMNKEKNFGHQEGFPIPMKKNYDWYS